MTINTEFDLEDKVYFFRDGVIEGKIIGITVDSFRRPMNKDEVIKISYTLESPKSLVYVVEEDGLFCSKDFLQAYLLGKLKNATPL